jgi:thioredoxin 2
MATAPTSGAQTRCAQCGTRNRVPIASAGKPRCGKCKADLPWLIDGRSADFDAIVSTSAMPVLVDLWAPWCGPCRMVAPILEELSVERAGSLRIVKVNVDEEPAISARFNARSIPTMLLFAHGVEVARQIGAMPKHGIVGWMDHALGAHPA